jgi:hypothetical protein
MRNIFYQITFISNANPLWITLLALLFTAASCKKEEEPKHKNIVTATINGQPWKAECMESTLFGCTSGDLLYNLETGGIELVADNLESGTGIRIRLKDAYDKGLFEIPDKQLCVIMQKEEPCGRRRHYIDQNDPQEIEITNIDNEKKLIEGRFHFVGRDTTCFSEPVHVKNGYFKVKYRP